MKQNEEACSSSRCRGGAMMKLVIYIVIFAGVLAAAWIFFLPAILTSTLQKRTGFAVKVAGLRFNPFNAKVDLTGFILANPESFPRSEFIEIRTFEANAKLRSLFSDRPEFDYARVDVAYVALVRSADGLLNTQLFHDRLYPPPPLTPEQIVAREKQRATAAAAPSKVIKDGVEITLRKEPRPAEKGLARVNEAEAARAAKPMKYLIKRLEVRLEKVVVADYTVSPASVREFDFKMHYTYNDVTNPNQLLTPFAFKSLEAVGAAIRGLIPGDIGRTIDATTKTGDDQAAPAEKRKAEDSLKTIVEKLEENQKP